MLKFNSFEYFAKFAYSFNWGIHRLYKQIYLCGPRLQGLYFVTVSLLS